MSRSSAHNGGSEVSPEVTSIVGQLSGAELAAIDPHAHVSCCVRFCEDVDTDGSYTPSQSSSRRTRPTALGSAAGLERRRNGDGRGLDEADRRQLLDIYDGALREIRRLDDPGLDELELRLAVRANLVAKDAYDESRLRTLALIGDTPS